MIRPCSRGLGLFVLAAALVGSVGQPGLARDDKDKPKKEGEKFKPPPLPDGYGSPQWDVAEIEKRFKIIRCEVEKTKSQITFLVELTDDEALLPAGELHFIDKDGVKFETYGFGASPVRGAKGDRVRLVVNNAINNGIVKDVFAKTTKLKFVLK